MAKKAYTSAVDPGLAILVDGLVAAYHGYAANYGEFPLFEKDPRCGFCEELFQFVVTDDAFEISEQDRGLVLLMARVAISTLYK